MKEKINFEYDVYNTIHELTAADKKLLEYAFDATKLAYSPYSNFKVGVAAMTNKDNLILGGNQENSSYSVTICAERALLASLSTQHPGEHITTIAITCIDQNGINQLVTPCGVCRQALFEHESVSGQKCRVILGSITGKSYIIEKVSDLLPLAFSL